LSAIRHYPGIAIFLPVFTLLAAMSLHAQDSPDVGRQRPPSPKPADRASEAKDAGAKSEDELKLERQEQSQRVLGVVPHNYIMRRGSGARSVTNSARSRRNVSDT
jgi:hypothetical protein